MDDVDDRLDRPGDGRHRRGTAADRAVRERIARRAGRPVRLKWVAVRDPAKPRRIGLDGVRLTDQAERLIDGPRGQRHHRDDGRDRSGVASTCWRHWPRARTWSRPTRRCWPSTAPASSPRRERRVGPWRSRGASAAGSRSSRPSASALAANQVQSLAAIVNGTCNFILTRMTSEGLPYDEALRQAQQLGYAEADPTLDVDGTDTAHKLAILAQLAFEANVRLDEIPRQGIDRFQPADLKYAGELGIRDQAPGAGQALARPASSCAWRPTLVRHGTPAGRGPRPLQRDPRRGRRRRRYPVLRPGGRRDAHGLGRRRRPHRRRDRPRRPPLAAEQPLVG